ncbi:kinase-like protein [Clavulina sp. PMI_390]|nr:kinase-like protein [Clavulina sp. PMI_390]
MMYSGLRQGNILLDGSGHPLLCDFGLCRIRHEVSRTRTMRQEGGRIRFLAPELSSSLEGQFRTTPASDIFSLAMTLLNIWTGEMPFAEVRNEWQVASRVNQGMRPNRLGGMLLSPYLNSTLWTLLEEMWAQKPNKRPSSDNVSLRLERVFNTDGSRSRT